MAIYAVAIVSMILKSVEISWQGNYNTFTAAYANDLTAAGQLTNLRNGGVNYPDLVQNLVTVLKEVNPD